MDLLYDLGEAMLTFMRSDPDFPVVFLYIALASIPVTLLHELGHALAARARLGAEVHVSVGSTGKLAELRLGQIAMSMNGAPPTGAPVVGERHSRERRGRLISRSSHITRCSLA